MILNKLIVCLLLFVIVVFIFAADIQAPKMEIVDSEQGRLTIFPQGIVVTDKENKISGKYAVFYERANRAQICDSVMIENPRFTITADTVLYSFHEKSSLLNGNVIVESDTLRIETASLLFKQSQNIITTQTDVKIKEKKQRLTIFSKKGMYNFADDFGVVDSEPVLYIERDDTTIVRGQKMVLENNAARFMVTSNVSAKTNQTILSCDSLIFYTDHDYGIAQVNPRITENENLLFGNTIEFYFAETANSNKTSLSNIRVLEQAHATYLTNDGGLLKVQGDEFLIYYEDGDIKQVKIFSDSLNYISGTFISKQKL
jgi:lipopolysaccharide export system protein LptA